LIYSWEEEEEEEEEEKEKEKEDEWKRPVAVGWDI
jgi:hypothetical protein